MLKLRILSALVMAPLVIGAIFFLEPVHFTLALVLIFAVGAWEWSRFSVIKSLLLQAIYPVVFILISSTIWFVGHTHSIIIDAILSAGVLWWLLAMLVIFRANRSQVEVSSTLVAAAKVQRTVTGLFVLLPSLLALSLLQARNYGPSLIMYMLFLIWVADSGAYFIGRTLGKHKLAVHVSPGKSWEGVAGGMVFSLLLAIVVVSNLDLTTMQRVLIVVLSGVTVWFSVIGDLMESLYKRRVGLKDSSHLIPGHGGLLDRIDSLTSAAPVFLLGLRWLERMTQ